MKDLNFDALIKKKRVTLMVLKATESGTKKALSSWSNLVKIVHEGTKCKLSLNFFDNLMTIIKTNLHPLAD